MFGFGSDTVTALCLMVLHYEWRYLRIAIPRTQIFLLEASALDSSSRRVSGNQGERKLMMADEEIIDAEVVEEFSQAPAVEPEVFPEVPEDDPLFQGEPKAKVIEERPALPKPKREPKPKPEEKPLNYATMTTRQQNKMRKLEVEALREWYEGGCPGKRPETPMFDFLAAEQAKAS